MVGTARELRLQPLPPGSTSRSLRAFLAESNPVTISLDASGQAATLTFASEADAERCTRRWDGYVEAMGLAGRGRGAGRGKGKSKGKDKTTAKNSVRRSNGHIANCVGESTAGQSSTNTNKNSASDTVERTLKRSAKKALEPNRQGTVEFPDADDWPASKRSAGTAKQDTRARAKYLTQQIASYAAMRQLENACATFKLLEVEDGLAPSVFSYANLINAHVNSGDVAGAAEVFQKMRAAGVAPNVIAYTALLKGHCRVSNMRSAAALLDDMVRQSPPVLPDTRCLNTFLRGCARVGDIESALTVFHKMKGLGVHGDSTSLKFVGTLLAHGLRMSELRALLREHVEAPAANTATASQDLPRASADDSDRPAPCKFWAQGRCNKGKRCQFYHDPSIVQERDRQADMERWDTAAALGVELARTAVLLGKWQAYRGARRTSIRMRKRVVAALKDGPGVDPHQQRLRAAQHREQKLELKRLSEVATSRKVPDLAAHLNRTFVFGSATANAQEVGKEAASTIDVPGHLVNALTRSFGLQECVKLGWQSHEAMLDSFRSCISETGMIKWERAVPMDTKTGGAVRKVAGKKRKAMASGRLPVKLEICSGSGEWVVAQAKAEAQSAIWGALEIMHDRVHNIFSRMAFEDVRNLCVIGGDAAHILPRHVESDSVNDIFINFPEPPHVTGNEAAESSLHLLTGSFFVQMHRVLVPGGRIIIFSDNQRYCRTLARTVASLRSQDVPPAVRGSVKRKRISKHGSNHSVGGPLFQSVAPAHAAGPDNSCEDVDGVHIRNGVPGKEEGHSASATSFFDSLWERGDRSERYFLVLAKT